MNADQAVSRMQALTRQRHDAEMAKIQDPDWRAAKEYAYSVGIDGLADLAYRVIKLEKRLAEAEKAKPDPTGHDLAHPSLTTATDTSLPHG